MGQQKKRKYLKKKENYQSKNKKKEELKKKGNEISEKLITQLNRGHIGKKRK